MHTEEIPYNENLNDKIDDNRIFSVGYSPRDRHFMDGFCFDYATLWGLFHFAGYDPLFNVYNQDASFGLNYVAAYNLGKIDYSLGNYRFNIVTYTALDIPFDYLRKWGVRWYVVSMKRSVYGGYLQKNNLIRKYEDERRIVFSDEQAIPLFYWRHNTSDVGIVYNIKTNSINLDVKNEKDDWLMINFLFSKFFNARVDNALANIQLNNYGQMALFIPEGQHEIVIRYSDPFFLLGVYIAAIFIGILIFCYLYKRTNGRFKKIKG